MMGMWGWGWILGVVSGVLVLWAVGGRMMIEWVFEDCSYDDRVGIG
jgi:hypothetical protein